MTNLRLTSTLIALILTSSGVNIGASQAHITNASASSTSSTTSTTMTTVSTDVSQSNEATQSKKQQRGCLSALYAWGLSWFTMSGKETKTITNYKNSTERNKQLIALLYELLPTMPLDLIKIIASYDYLFKGRYITTFPKIRSVDTLVALPDGKVAANYNSWCDDPTDFPTTYYNFSVIIWSPVVNNQHKEWEPLHFLSVKQDRNHFTILIALHDRKLAIATTDERSSTIGIYTETGILLQTLLVDKCEEPPSLAALPNNKLASGDWEKGIRIWNLTTGKCERLLGELDDESKVLWGNLGSSLNRATEALLALPGNLLASGGALEATIQIWDLTEQSGHESIDKPKCISTLKGHSRFICALIALSNNKIASCSIDTTIRVWNLKTQRCERLLTGHTKEVLSIVLLPDGTIASSSADRTVKIWDLTRPIGKECIHTIKGHKDWIKALAVLPDGRLLSGSHDKTIKVWE